MIEQAPGQNEAGNVSNPASTGPQPDPHSPLSFGKLPSAEAVKMATWAKEDLANNKISHEQASKIWDSLATPADQRHPDTRTDEMKTLHAQFPPAKGSDYVIRYHPPGRDEPMTQEQKDFDVSARAWLCGAEFPREHGNTIVNTIERVATQTKGMNEAQLEIYGRDEFAKLQRVHGEKLEERLNRAGKMVAELELKRPGLKQLLQSGGLGDSAQIASMLIAQSEIYYARKEGRGL